jgi:hypothetical protein
MVPCAGRVGFCFVTLLAWSVRHAREFAPYAGLREEARGGPTYFSRSSGS